MAIYDRPGIPAEHAVLSSRANTPCAEMARVVPASHNAFQAIDLGQDELLQPGDGRHRGKRLGGHLPLPVVTSQNLLILVDDARSIPSGVLAQRRQPPVLLIGAGGNVNLTQAANRLALQQAIAIDP